MTEQDFIKHIEQGYNLIPLKSTLINDGLDPIDVYQKLSNMPKSYLLESLEGKKDWSRYTIIGLPSEEYIELKDNKIKYFISNKLVEDIETNNPIDWIEEFQNKFNVPNDLDLPKFQGGLVGYFGFDTVKYFEPAIKATIQKDEMDTPDICLIVSKEFLIFDKINNKIHIVIYTNNNLNSFKESQDKIKKLEIFLRDEIIPEDNIRKQANYKINNLDIHYHFNKNDFISSVDKIKQFIINGDVMQVVLSQRMSMDFVGEPINFYRELRELNPSPYMYYLNMGDYQIVGSSPEILVRLEDDLITVRPIAGTRPRGKNENEDNILENELRNDPKELAEHLMLIDLGRNDAGKVSKVGSIKLTDKMIIEKYSHVMHMVSNVTGSIEKKLGMMDVLKSTFPAGTVSGAPKIRAIDIIYELESIKRGIYAGAIGYLGWNGNMDTAIAIRTCVIKDGKLNIQCGAGIVNDSIAELEWEETLNKGKAIVQAYKNLRNK
ncbi:MAG: anthranilate synthase component 1 [Gammaproteobacteria bacterium]|jgi:anthranilate synthase component 1|tara:strand:- start:876 stop:2348 length:1473 start_codon:yes stop_codon:yes gene_type:complete